MQQTVSEGSAPSTQVGAIDANALSSMFQCVAGLRNLRAARAMFTCFLLAVLLGSLVGSAGNPGFARVAFGGLLAAVLFFTGIHAAGVLLMDQARGVPLRSVMDAVTYALRCVPRTIGLIVVLMLAVLAVNLLVAVLFYLSKIPGLGVLLFAVVFPLSVLATGLMTTAVFLGFQMALAAMWEGATLLASVARAVTILRVRFVESVLLLMIVSVIAGVVMLLVSVVLFTGFWPATGMATLIVGGFGLSGLSAFSGSILSGSASGYAMAGVIGTGLLWALGATLVFQVGLLGVNLVYLRVGDGLDAQGLTAAMAAGVRHARDKAAEMGQKAKEAAESVRTQAQEFGAHHHTEQPASAQTQPVPHSSVACPECHVPVAVSDVFCGSCGHRLKQV